MTDSLSVLSQEWKSVLGIMYIFFLSSGIAFLCLQGLLRNRYAVADYLALSLAGGLVPLYAAILLVWCFDLWFRVRIDLVPLLEWLFILIGAFRIFRSLRVQTPIKRTLYIPLLLLLILAISVFLRLGFIAKLVVPLYFDSAAHYSIIQGLIADFQTSTFPTYRALTGSYYHLGFHVLAAAVSQALNIDPSDTMLILGQVFLSLIPLPLYLLIKQITKLELPALISVLLAGWGWYMPAHSVNWGKYPALLSLLALELVLCSAFLVFRSSRAQRGILIAVFASSILLAAFIHTRALILIVIVFLSLAIALVWYRLSQVLRVVLFCILLGALLAFMIIIQTNGILNLALDPYRGNGIWMTVLILLLFPFAVTEFPRLAFASVASILFLLVSLFISVAKFVPYAAAQALLDRAFVEMVLFLPLALLGGLGVAGLMRTMEQVSFFQAPRRSWVRWAVLIWILGIFFLNVTRYEFSPTCCLLFTQNDQAALGWMEKNTPVAAGVVVASSEAVMFQSSSSIYYPGSDGGSWISPMIHRNAVFFPYWKNFSDSNVLGELCQRRAGYIYIGGTGQSFDRALVSSRPDWYEKVFDRSGVQIYRIVGCPF